MPNSNLHDDFIQRAGPHDFRNLQSDSLSPMSKAERGALERWKASFQSDRPELLTHRMDWDHLDEAAVQLLHRSHDKTDPRVSPWYLWTSELSKFLQSHSIDTNADQESYPFCHLIEPIVLFLLSRLKNRASELWHIVLPSAVSTMSEGFRALFRWLLEETLYIEFDVFRCAYEHASEDPQKEEECDILYKEFIRRSLANGLEELFAEYPVLARLVGNALIDQVDHLSEFFTRLYADLPDLNKFVSSQVGLNAITRLDISASDRHNRGRSVIIVTFSTGIQLVYKPKSLLIDDAVRAFMARISQDLPACVPAVIARANYGWSSFVDHQECSSEASFEKYYKRVGAILCTIYILGGTDFHSENIIACGLQPMLVDLETFFSPQDFVNPLTEALHPSVRRAHEIVRYSVLSSGLLPRWETGPEGIMFDVTGLGGHSEQETPFRQTRWHAPNTDLMRRTQSPFVWSSKKHQPFRGDQMGQANEFLEVLILGFRETYDHVIRLTTETAPETLLADFAGLSVRFIHRPSRLYAEFLNTANHPEFLRHGAERRRHFDRLTHTFLSSEERPSIWPVVKHEIADLEVLDIPNMQVAVDSIDIHTPNGMVKNAFRSSGLTMARKRLCNLSTADCEQQIALISESFAAYQTQEVTQLHEGSQSTSTSSKTTTDVSLIAAAAEIGRNLWGQGIRADGGAAWIAPQYVHKSGRFQVLPIGHSLYDGVCGIGLFFAALSKVTGDRVWRERCDSSLASLWHSRHSDTARHITEDGGLGAGTGLGSVLFALARIATLTGKSQPIALAEDLLHGYSWKRDPTSVKPDLCIGNAGGIVGFLALFEITSDPRLLSEAVSIGEELVGSCCAQSDGRAWITLENKALAGMAHGAAGICLALYRLYDVTGESKFKRAADAAIEYENTLYSSDNNNWRDLRHDAEQLPAMNSWCHGATGIGMSRLSCLGHNFNKIYMEDVARAVNSVYPNNSDGVDHVCCGNAGRSDLLIMAAKPLERPFLREKAIQLLGEIADRGSAQGYRLTSNPARAAQNPTFFRGLSGIGYQLLRAENSDVLPSVLAFE